MNQIRIIPSNVLEINKIPEDIHTIIGKYLNNASLYNLLLSSKYNFNIQKFEIKTRYENLVNKYNIEEMAEKYCKDRFKCTWYVFIEIFKVLKNTQKKEVINDLENIIKLILTGYKGYNKYLKDMIFLLMPWSVANHHLLYFLKKMIKKGILDANIKNMSGAYPIGHAVAYNNYEAVKILAEYGNACEPLTNKNWNILIRISKKNSYIYKYLIKQRSNVII
mgnify:CR=1 FL=1|jgi:hypothetical protein